MLKYFFTKIKLAVYYTNIYWKFNFEFLQVKQELEKIKRRLESALNNLRDQLNLRRQQVEDL